MTINYIDGTDIISNLSAHWKMDEIAGAMADASGNGETGTINGTITQNQTALGGIPGKSVTIARNVANFVDGFSATIVGDFTIAAFIQISDNSVANVICGDAGDTSAFYLTAGATTEMGLRVGSANDTVTVAPFVNDTTYHVAVVRSGTTLTFYVDGVADAEAPTAASSNLIIDQIFLGRTTPDPFGGKLDDLRVYARALSAADVLKLKNTPYPALSDGLFDILGKYIHARNTLDTSRATTVAAEVLDAIDQYRLKADATLRFDAAMAGVAAAEKAWRRTGSTLSSALNRSMKNFLIEVVKADSSNASGTLTDALEYLISEMTSDGYYVTPSVPTVGSAFDTGVIGDTTVTTTIVNGAGRDSENAYAEVIRLEATATGVFASLTAKGERKAASNLSEEWPAGSNVAATIAPLTLGDNLLSNGGFDEYNPTNSPQGWIVQAGSVGTDLRAGLYKVQTVTISNDTTNGTYQLRHTHSHLNILYWTSSLAWNASGAEVQAALRLLPQLADITVTTSITEGTITHTITMTNVPDQPLTMTSTNNTDGTISHAVVVAGDAGSVTKRGLVIPNSDNQVTLYQQITLDVQTVYACGFWLHSLTSSDPAAGSLKLTSVLGGAALVDDEGVSQSISWSNTGNGRGHHDGFFRLKKTQTMPVFLEFDSNGADIFAIKLMIDDLILAPAQRLYAGGPYVAVYPGTLENRLGNKWTLTVGNDYAGLWQKDFDREFDMKAKGLFLPSSGTTLINNNLIG